MKRRKPILTHRGYQGSVEASIEDDCLFGQMLHIDDLVSYEGDTLAALRSNFEDAVDDYLQTCEELGREPDKGYSGTFNVRLTPELHRIIARESASAGITINQFVRHAVEAHVEAIRFDARGWLSSPTGIESVVKVAVPIPHERRQPGITVTGLRSSSWPTQAAFSNKQH